MTTEKKKTPVWVWVLLVVVGLPMTMCVGAMALGFGAAAKVAADSERESAEVAAAAAETPPGGTDAPAAKVLDVDLSELLAEYKDNEVRADSKFKKQIVRFTGKVNNIKNDLAGDPYVTVGTGKQFEIPEVQCSLSKSSAAAAAELSKGAEVTVVGRVSGLMMNVQLKDCVIQGATN